MVTIFQKQQISKVNARHLLDDIATAYRCSIEEAVLTEAIANSLDAKSSIISISVNNKEKSITFLDNGTGMKEIDFEKYHDLAESRKEKGQGIGFAGLGAKLSHKLAKKIVTETKSQTFHGSSQWNFKDDDLVWSYNHQRTLNKTGTKVTLYLNNETGMLGKDFLEHRVRKYYGALLDPNLTEVYIWKAIYPNGVRFEINGSELANESLLDSPAIENSKKVDIRFRKKLPIGRAIFVLAREPIPDEEQGIAITTYGKTIRREPLHLKSRHPERITGWFESPELVECLTLNKQEFTESGPTGEKFRRIKRELQSEFNKWLTSIGEMPEMEARQRATKILEQETAQILRKIPKLWFLFSVSMKDKVAVFDSNGELNLNEVSRIAMPPLESQPGAEAKEDKQSGEDLQLFVPGPSYGEKRSRIRSKKIRGAPRIERIKNVEREEISWVDGDTVFVNSAHPAYLKSERNHLLSYHERLAIFYAVCLEASIDPEEKLRLLNETLTAWGKR